MNALGTEHSNLEIDSKLMLCLDLNGLLRLGSLLTLVNIFRV